MLLTLAYKHESRLDYSDMRSKG